MDGPAAREVAARLAGLIGRVLGDPVDDLMEKLAAVSDLARRRTVLWCIPNPDGTVWDEYRFRSFPARASWTDALAYLAYPDRLHLRAELWDAERAWWTPVADIAVD